MSDPLPDLSRCISVHWSLPVQCVLSRAHRENWHEAWHPETGNRLRYRYSARATEELHHSEWHTLNIPGPARLLEQFTAQRCAAGEHADWALDSEGAHACPWCEVERLLAQLERECGESMFWHFEYREAMDNYRGENWQVGQLRAELAKARAAIPSSCCGAEPVHQAGCGDDAEPICHVLNPRKVATCTEPPTHGPDRRDAFGNTWPRRDGDKPLFAEEN
jgi:hypothetical protein